MGEPIKAHPFLVSTSISFPFDFVKKFLIFYKKRYGIKIK